MNQKQKAKELVNKIYQPMGYLAGLNMNSKQMCDWASDRAIEEVSEIVEALNITTSHCELRRIDQQEVQSDFAFWDGVKTEIDALR